MPVSIIVNQTTRPAGVAGKARSDGVVGQLVTLSNATAEASYLWTLVDVPIRSALTRGATGVAPTFTFTPDVKGTYLVRLQVNGSSDPADNGSTYFAIRSFGSKALGWRYKAQGETAEDNETYPGLGFPSDVNPRGWATDEDLVYEDLEEAVWEIQNALTSYAGLTSRIVMTNPATGKVDSTLIPGSPAIGAAGGDLTGSYPSPTVAGIRGRAVSSTFIPSDGQTFWWNATSSEFQLSSKLLNTSTGMLFDTHALPASNLVYDLGSSTLQWRTVFAETVNVDTLNVSNFNATFPDGTEGAPGIAFTNEVASGVWRDPVAPAVAISSSGMEVARFQAPGGVDPQLVLPLGSAAKPSLVFGTTGSGLYSTASQVITTFAGSARWAFGNDRLHSLWPGAVTYIRTQGVNSVFTISGRADLTTSALPSITLSNYNDLAFVGASIDQRLVALKAIVNQTGTSSFTALDIDVTRTALGSGAQRFLDLKADGTTYFEISSRTSSPGRVRGPDGDLANPTYSFLANTGTGMTRAATGELQLVHNGSEKVSVEANQIIHKALTRVPSGSATEPSITAEDYPQAGIRWISNNEIRLPLGGQDRVTVSTTALTPSDDLGVSFGSSSNRISTVHTHQMNVRSDDLGSGSDTFVSSPVTRVTASAICPGNTTTDILSITVPPDHVGTITLRLQACLPIDASKFAVFTQQGVALGQVSGSVIMDVTDIIPVVGGLAVNIQWGTIGDLVLISLEVDGGLDVAASAWVDYQLLERSGN